MNQSAAHVPVMLEQALNWLAVDEKPGKLWVDATAGAGGHLCEIIARAGSDAVVIGIDRDSHAIAELQRTLAFADLQPHLVHTNYSNVSGAVKQAGASTVSGGILGDLGVSSMQLDNPERGFSFMQEGPLDMRMDPQANVTAQELINSLPEQSLADIVYRYGEERLSRPIARAIVSARPLRTTGELADVVSRVVRRYRRGRRPADSSHPATRTFQAIRIAVNDELTNMERFLRESIKLLEPGARLVVITFHSLEDRIVKQIFRESASLCVCPPRQPVCTCAKTPAVKILTPKPVLPRNEEVLANPRSRSAKLRAVERVAEKDAS